MTAGGRRTWLLSLAAGVWWKLSLGDIGALLPYGVFPFLKINPALDTTQTPALVVFEYRIRKEDRSAFLQLMKSVSAIRQRNGGAGWGVYEDLGQPGRWLEQFVVDSPAEMERTRQRTTDADYAILQQAYALHQGPGASPTITRLVAPPPGE